MFIWLSMQLWQLMFGVPISGDGLVLVRVFGYAELLFELVFLVGF